MILTIAGKELGHHVNSLLGYLLAAVFVMTLPYPIFWSDANTNIFLNGNADLRPFFAMMPFYLVIFVPALAMRTWAEERGAGTLEILLTAPLSERDLVLGKFMGNFILLAVCILGTIGIPILVNQFGEPDRGPVIGGYVGCLLLGAACLAAAQCVGVLVKSQVVAFILAITLLAALMLVDVPAINFRSRFFNIARGIIDSRDVIYYLSATVFFLFLNIRLLERRG